ncbi:MAG TPA: hypothetical protein VIV60_21020 [Polyangiaceae bacterium]
MIRECLVGWCAAVTLGLGACSTQASAQRSKTALTTSSAEPGSADDVTDFTLTQNTTGRPERGNCPNPGGCMGSAPEPAPQAPASNCEAELCEGELTQQGIADLRAAAAKAEDCYEAELRAYEREKLDHQKLEGHLLLRIRLAAGEKPCSIGIERKDFDPSERFANCVFDKLRQTAVRPISGCIDLALPLVFVRKEVDSLPDGGVPAGTPPSNSK